MNSHSSTFCSGPQNCFYTLSFSMNLRFAAVPTFRSSSFPHSCFAVTRMTTMRRNKVEDLEHILSTDLPPEYKWGFQTTDVHTGCEHDIFESFHIVETCLSIICIYIYINLHSTNLSHWIPIMWRTPTFHMTLNACIYYIDMIHTQGSRVARAWMKRLPESWRVCRRSLWAMMRCLSFDPFNPVNSWNLSNNFSPKFVQGESWEATCSLEDLMMLPLLLSPAEL